MEECQARDNESKDTRVLIKTGDLKLVYALSREDLRFFGDFMSRYCEKHQLYGATEDEGLGRLTDPRCFSYEPDTGCSTTVMRIPTLIGLSI